MLATFTEQSQAELQEEAKN